VVIGLAAFDVDRLLKKNGHVDREQLLAKKGYKALPLRLWAILLQPVYLFKRARLLGQKQVHLIIWSIAFVFSMCFAALMALGLAFSNHDDHAVQSVRGGTLESYPGMTLGKALESFMPGAKWESLVADDGKTYVNVKGRVEFQGKPVTARIQYRLDENGGFEFQAFEVNGVPQPPILYMGLIEKAYEEAQKGHAQSDAPSGKTGSATNSTANDAPPNGTGETESTTAFMSITDVLDVYLEFDKNASAALAKYKGKRMRLSGYVDSAVPYPPDDRMTHLYINSGPEEGHIANAIFGASERGAIQAALARGSRVSFEGTVEGLDGSEFTLILIENCKIIR
jgi:hypothetical protein